MKIELQNKAILVTGANSGIGFAIAFELLNAVQKLHCIIMLIQMAFYP